MFEIVLWLALAGLLYLSTIFFGYVRIPPDLFKGKVVWITGASSGIGEALAKEFYRSGAKVILSARRQEELQRVAKECQSLAQASAAPAPALLLLDLEDLDSLPAKAANAIQCFGRIDILINNGGASSRGLALDTSFGVDLQLAKVNFLSAVCLTKLILAHMILQGKGTVIAVNSIQGQLATPERTAYTASKHALHGFFQSLRMEMSNDKSIHIMEVFPGYVNTSLSLNALTGDGRRHGKVDPTTASGFSPDYVAKRILEGLAERAHSVYIAKPLHRWSITLMALAPRFVEKMLIKRAEKMKR